MTFKIYSFIFLSLLFFCQCKKDDTQISDKTIEKLTDCRENPLPDSLEIVNKIIGNWEIEGYACSHCTPHEAPKAEVEFSETKGTLVFKEDGEEEISLDFDWYLQKLTILSPNRTEILFQMRTIPTHYALQMNNYCEKYMSFDNRAEDGVMFLYQKK